jgi:hypothetical protein
MKTKTIVLTDKELETIESALLDAAHRHLERANLSARIAYKSLGDAIAEMSEQKLASVNALIDKLRTE